MNEKPHVLTAVIDPNSWGGVEWHLECPYEGDRECGILVDCKDPDHEAPVPPSEPEDEPLSEAWKAYYEAWDEWREECPSNGHPGPQCWYAYMINNNEDEPEYWLAELDKTPISGPLQVAVRTDGYDEDAQIVLTPWTPEETS